VISVSVGLSVCLSVCPQAYPRNHSSELHQIFAHVACAVARSFSGGEAIRYVLSVLWMTSYFPQYAGMSNGSDIPLQRRHCSVVHMLTHLLLGAGCVLSHDQRRNATIRGPPSTITQ